MLVLSLILKGFSALLLALVWTAYLRRIDIFKSEKWGWVILMFSLGTLTVIPIFVFDLPEFRITKYGASFINMLVYYTWNVGFFEELVKFAAFLVIWFAFRKKIFDEAPNYIVMACLSALGFATVENFKYFLEVGVHIVYLRGMMSTFTHMACSAIVVSFFYRGLRRGPVLAILYTLSGFIVASLAHGLYDALLTYPFGGYPVIGILLNLTLYLIGIEVFVRLLNNFLNLSEYFDPKKSIDWKLVQRLLLIAFFIAGAIQLTGLLIKYGWYQGIYGNIGILVQEIAFTIILVIRMSRFTFVRGKWFPVWPVPPITLRSVPVYDPETRQVEKNLVLAVRGDQFNEYPYTKNLYETVLLSPLFRQHTYLGEPVFARMADKVFLGNYEIYYVMELLDAELSYPGKHSRLFLLKPKVLGVNHVKKQPIAGFMLLPESGFSESIQPSQLHFLEWVVMESTVPKLPKRNLLRRILE